MVENDAEEIISIFHIIIQIFLRLSYQGFHLNLKYIENGMPIHCRLQLVILGATVHAVTWLLKCAYCRYTHHRNLFSI